MGASVIFGITCVLLPLIAWIFINQHWEFYIPFINVVYKPWRLFLVVCGLPSLICSIILTQLPESPKFVLSQGMQEEAIAILQKMYLTNGGDVNKPIEIPSIIEELESIAYRQKRIAHKDDKLFILRSMWSQTAPLFKEPNLKRTFLACFLQFGIYVTSNGMYMWFPEILNRMADYNEKNPDNYLTLCEVLDLTKINITAVMTSIDEIKVSVDVRKI